MSSGAAIAVLLLASAGAFAAGLFFQRWRQGAAAAELRARLSDAETELERAHEQKKRIIHATQEALRRASWDDKVKQVLGE